MKKRTVLVLALTLCLSCRRLPQAVQRTEIRLVKDYPFAEQVNFVRPRDASFMTGYERFGEKRFETLVQKQPGSIAFSLRLYDRPVLSYALQFQARKTSELDALVTVESDFPSKISRDFKPVINQRHSLDLAEFSNRVAKITFSARSRNLNRLGGVLGWINPVVEQQEPAPPVLEDRLEAFRKRESRNNLLIFLFDAASAKHLSGYGYSRHTTPVMDDLAAGGVLWRNAFSQAVSTLASTGTLFTGVPPDVHHVLKKPSALHERFKTMAECFREEGFETALFTANPNASGMGGYDQGFKYVWNLRKGDTVDASEVVPFVNTWLDQVRQRRFFAYVHFREPHEPYNPPASALSRFTSVPDFKLPYFEAFLPPDPEGIQKVITAYDANLFSGDEQFGKVIEHLKQSGLLEKTIIVVIADHGESFWGHGKQGHNSQVYDDMIHIPMIMRFPQSPEVRGMKPDYLAATIDLFPTFADLYQFSRKGLHLKGQSLLPALFQKRGDTDRLIVSQTSSQDAYSLRSREFKYIHYPGGKNPPEFYCLTSDPAETRNTIAEYPVLASYFRSTLLKQIEENKRLKGILNAGPERTAVVDKETEEELRALGYIN